MMTTDNPETKPLPDPGLLEMQWHLQRILAMSGAARWREEDFDDFSFGDGDYPVYAAYHPPSVELWLDDLPEDFNRSSSPSESLEVVDGP
jgi:hypothetical protein